MKIIKGEELKGMTFIRDEEGRLVVYERPKGRFIPKEYETYCYITEYGNIRSAANTNTTMDKWMFNHSLVFEKEKEAEDYKLFLEQLDTHKYEFSREEWKNNDINKYAIYYDNSVERLLIEFRCCCQRGAVYFKTEEDAQNFIKEAGEKRIKKYMFDVWE